MQGPETLQVHVKNSIGFLKISQALNTFKVQACEKNTFSPTNFRQLQDASIISERVVLADLPEGSILAKAMLHCLQLRRSMQRIC